MSQAPLPTLVLDRAGIAARIPHAGDMCLLDGVLASDDLHVRAISRAHLLADNPLARDGRLGILNAIEFAAQAMALHGSLRRADGSAPRAGYLISVREVTCSQRWLDDNQEDLVIEADLVAQEGSRVIYEFRVLAGDRVLVAGRANAVLDITTTDAARQSASTNPEH